MVEQRDFIRWFKQGWVFIIITTILGLIISHFGVNSITAIAATLISNPAGALSGLIALGILGLLWGLLVFPIVSGWLIEWIRKKIRR